MKFEGEKIKKLLFFQKYCNSFLKTQIADFLILEICLNINTIVFIDKI